MTEPIDWSLTTWEGNRRRQHEEFLALPLREKIKRIEEMCEMAELFAARRKAEKAKAVHERRGGAHDSPSRQ